MNKAPTSTQPGVSVIIPCHDEEGAVAATIADVREALGKVTGPWEVIAVNDGSYDTTGKILDELAGRLEGVRVIHNRFNRGYGASLKRGLAEAQYDRVLITDADGTYPNSRIPEFIAGLESADMVVGARIGSNVQIPWARRPAKWALLKYARWMAKADIKDVNSGMRAIWARHVHTFWYMLPDGFSFTTTITMASHINRLHVDYLPIDYFKRVGKSSIRPLRDTFNFFLLVLRSTMYFRPLQVFGSLALIMMLLALGTAVVAKATGALIPDIFTITVFMAGVNFLGLGLLGDLINSHRPW